MKTTSKGLVVFAGLLAAPVAPRAEFTTLDHHVQRDPRLVRLESYLDAIKSPIKSLAADFIEAADTQDLDWRLLPSIAVVESGGGKHYVNNNVFGWASNTQRFRSVRAGIHFVAEKLANSPYYKDKNLDQLLRTYNSELSGYPRLVKGVMKSIGAPDFGMPTALN